MCAGSRECAYKRNMDIKDNSATFGMLCKRPCNKEVVVKFEKIHTAAAARKKRKKKHRSAR